MTVTRFVLIIALVASTAVHAQPASVVGKPLPSPDLPTGSVTVRVVDGSPDAPAANVTVTLTAGKTKQTAVSDAQGRARFDGVTASAKVSIGKGALATSETFTMPAEGGVRVLLSRKPWSEPARHLSGSVLPAGTPAGTLDVRLTYDNLGDAKPPAGVPVTLVAYAADDTVTVVQNKSDGKGMAHFENLDTGGSVAYFALAQLPRKKAIDRLMTEPITLATEGMRVTLSGEQRTSTAVAIDDLVDAKLQAAVAGAKRKVRVQLEGAADPDTPLEVIDAASGKVVAKANAATTETMVDVPVRAGQVLYVTASSKYARYRSMPFQMVADRGAAVSIYIYPRLLPTFELLGIVDDNLLAVRGRISISNNAWIPYAENGRGPTVPLPRGAMRIELADEDKSKASIKNGALEIKRPLSPGVLDVEVSFELPAKAGTVSWSLDLPLGAYKSSFDIEKEQGLSIEKLPPGVKLDTRTTTRATYLTLDDITITPKQAMTMTIKLPAPSRDNKVLHACRRLSPDASPLVGTSIDFTLLRLDGSTLELSSLRGKPVLVNVMATWDMLSKTERPTLAALANQTGMRVVMVASDRDPKEVASTVGKLPFPVVLDPPPTANDNIGSVTTSWGIKLLPENLLVDAMGVVRYHFQNSRAWDTPEAIRCVKAFSASK